MSTCSRCGNPIEFRYVGGRCLPLHIHGACTAGNLQVNDYSGHTVNHDSTCFCTNCPECGDEVFFIRFNGGAVWIDPPLGPPWYHHGCFDNSSPSNSRSSLAKKYNVSISESKTVVGSSQTIGVVKSTYVDYSKTYTEVILETGKSENKKLGVKNNAGFLLGKLCIYNQKTQQICPVDAPSYVFTLCQHKKIHPNMDFSLFDELSKTVELINCPECDVKLNPKNLKKHLRKQHEIS